MSRSSTRPTWAPRLSRYKIARLYHTDAKGVGDEELADDVGCGILARIDSCLTVTEAHRGRVKCPGCGRIIQRKGGHRDRMPNELLVCDECGWELPWPEYHRSYRKKHLGSGGLESFFREFAEQYPKAGTYQEKMILIDTLLHRYHWELEGDPGGPGAVNLIGGTRNEVLAFLSELTYGESSTPGLGETRDRWRKTLRYGNWGKGDDDRLIDTYRWEGHRGSSAGRAE